MTDIMLEATEADCAILNSGTLRSDTVHPKGEFKVKDLMSILPMVDPILVISATGELKEQYHEYTSKIITHFWPLASYSVNNTPYISYYCCNAYGISKNRILKCKK